MALVWKTAAHLVCDQDYCNEQTLIEVEFEAASVGHGPTSDRDSLTIMLKRGAPVPVLASNVGLPDGWMTDEEGQLVCNHYKHNSIRDRLDKLRR